MAPQGDGRREPSSGACPLIPPTRRAKHGRRGVRGSVAPVPPGQGCPLPFARPSTWGAGSGTVSRSLSADQQSVKVYAPEADSVNPPAPDEPGLRVHATEYRVAPDAWFKTFRLRGGEIEEKTKVDDQRESAWLVHFKRTRPNDGRSAHPLNSHRLYGSRNIATRRYDVKDAARPPFLRFWPNRSLRDLRIRHAATKIG